MSIINATFKNGTYRSVQLTPSIVTTNLLLHLDAGNATSYPGSGSTWTDLISSRAFTLYNSPTYNSANGGYISFSSASSQYAQCPSSLPTMANFTVEVWCYLIDTPSSTYPAIICETVEDTPSECNYSIECANGGNNISAVTRDATQALVYTDLTYTVARNAWCQLVATCDGSTLKLYFNGALAKSVADTQTLVSKNQGIYLMRRRDATYFDTFGGRLAVARIYNADIGASGILNNYNIQKSRFGLS
jgi:Concanavalin A-like lectin/glucanases superfamily